MQIAWYLALASPRVKANACCCQFVMKESRGWYYSLLLRGAAVVCGFRGAASRKSAYSSPSVNLLGRSKTNLKHLGLNMRWKAFCNEPTRLNLYTDWYTSLNTNPHIITPFMYVCQRMNVLLIIEYLQVKLVQILTKLRIGN